MLYIVATPLGNLDDISGRARMTLREADLVACEDTRVTRKLLKRFGVVPKLVSLHRHSDQAEYREVAEAALTEDVAYTTDAGTPGVSDPAQRLLDCAWEMNVEIVPIPGPSAITTAMSLAPFGGGPFRFVGFLPKKDKALGDLLDELENSREPAVCFTSPNRAREDIAAISSRLQPERRLLVCRELTKEHETLRLNSLADWSDRVDQLEERGEFTLVLEGAAQVEPRYRFSEAELIGLGERLVEAGVSPRTAAELVGEVCPEVRGKLRSELYN